jgi:lipopolysaccharide transport system ATP-binding protein
MSCDIAIHTSKLSKCYTIFNRPEDRLRQMLSFGRRKYYRDFWALRDVSIEVGRGETVGVIGRNGSGKSTLLHLICRTLTPTSGELEVNGRVAALLELGTGFNPEFTGLENVFMSASVLGLNRSQIEKRLSSIVDFAAIDEFINQPVRTYSSGMYVRLAFAVAAHVDADILIVDEALAVGDYLFQQKCMRFLRNFMREGTVLFASHDMSAIKSLCTSALWLDGGRPRFFGDAREVCDRYLSEFMEIQQGTSDIIVKDIDEKLARKPRVVIDQRQKYLNNSRFRNDIEVFTFDTVASSFGKGGATIINVQLLDKKQQPLSWIVGGETVILSLQAQAHKYVEKPIMGFYIKDRLGQYLFGDNTYMTFRDAPKSINNGELLEAQFQFQMPLLPTGKYSVCAAVAEGTQDDHVQHHWVHDALIFESHASPINQGGLVGIPMVSINLTISAG